MVDGSAIVCLSGFSTQPAHAREVSCPVSGQGLLPTFFTNRAVIVAPTLPSDRGPAFSPRSLNSNRRRPLEIRKQVDEKGSGLPRAVAIVDSLIEAVDDARDEGAAAFPR